MNRVVVLKAKEETNRDGQYCGFLASSIRRKDEEMRSLGYEMISCNTFGENETLCAVLIFRETMGRVVK